ncbi:hypothetical protein FACS189483_07660 [Spirochaetia bacterium]|nr:hypothetical protein FACS189483_07660 [Spirochaetia bacterium]
MANEKNPSIYFDRSTIGSSEELDEYGVWVKSEPQDFSSVVTQYSSSPDEVELPDFDDFAIGDLGTDDLTPFQDDSSDLGDAGRKSPLEDTAGFGADDDFALPVEDTENLLEDFNTETEILDDGEDGFAEVAMEEFLDGLPAAIEETSTLDETAAVDVAEPSQKDEAPGADAAVHSSSEPGVSVEPPGSTETHDVEISTQLLMKIADELASIKAEISGLKKELADVRGESQEGRGEFWGGGNLDEEDDAKLALTGDELENILNTADFTEETGADANIDPFDAGSSFPIEDTLDEDPLNLMTEESENPEAEIFPIIEDSPELQLLREEGVEPLTPAPEDTSYLEEDFPVSDDDAEPSIEPTKTGIDEPDVKAPAPPVENIFIDLDLDEPFGNFGEEDEALNDSAPVDAEPEMTIDTGFDISPDIDFDTPSGNTGIAEDESFAQVIPEGFVVEADETQPAGTAADESVIDFGKFETEADTPPLPADNTSMNFGETADDELSIDFNELETEADATALPADESSIDFGETAAEPIDTPAALDETSIDLDETASDELSIDFGDLETEADATALPADEPSIDFGETAAEPNDTPATFDDASIDSGETSADELSIDFGDLETEADATALPVDEPSITFDEIAAEPNDTPAALDETSIDLDETASDELSIDFGDLETETDTAAPPADEPSIDFGETANDEPAIDLDETAAPPAAAAASPDTKPDAEVAKIPPRDPA